MSRWFFVIPITLCMLHGLSALEVSYCVTPQNTLEIVINPDETLQLHQDHGRPLPLQTPSSSFQRPLRNNQSFANQSLIISPKNKVFAGYNQEFGRIAFFKINGAKKKLPAFQYPEPSAPFLASDDQGNIWSIRSEKDQTLIGRFALRSVTGPNGIKTQIKLHKLTQSSVWCGVLDNKIYRESPAGELEHIAYLDWFGYFDGKQLQKLPMTRPTGFPSYWTGSINTTALSQSAGTREELIRSALSKNNPEDLKQLIADQTGLLQTMDEQESSPLIMTVLSSTEPEKRIRLIEFLIEQGCSINRADQHGNTPLLRVASLDNLYFTSLFLQNGADPNQRNKSEQTPLHLAAQGRLYLTETGKMTRSCNPRIMTLLIEKGAKVDARDKWGQTPLHQAAKFLQLYAAEVLLKVGADANAQDNDGDTPGIAAVKGWDIMDADGKTRHFFRNEEMVHLLAHYGCDWKIKNKKGETYVSLFLSDPHADENKIPDRLSRNRPALAKYSDFSNMKNFIFNSSYEDMTRMFGAPHQYRKQDCFIDKKVLPCVVFWYWSDRDYYQFTFKELVIRLPAAQMTFNFAQANKPQGNQVTLDNPDKEIKFMGGELIRFKSNTSQLTEPVHMTDGLKVHDLKLFESGNEFLPKERQQYTDTFDSASARYINWLLTFDHPGLKRDKSFVLNVDFYRQGTLHCSGFQKTRIEKNWTDSYHTYGWGQEKAGFWPGGQYRIVIRAGGTILVEKHFTVK